MAITLETKPGTKPRTNKLETKLGTNLAASAWTQDTATRVPHASITKLAHLGLGGGWGARGLDGPALRDRAQKPPNPSKEACGEAAPKEPLRHASNYLSTEYGRGKEPRTPKGLGPDLSRSDRRGVR